jgi:hypothetical protein
MITRETRGLVYFIVFPDSNEVKVGLSTEAGIDNRIRQLRTWRAGQRFRILKTIPGTRATEKALHRIFRPHRIGGELFHYKPLALFIDALKSLEEPQLPLPGLQVR